MKAHGLDTNRGCSRLRLTGRHPIFEEPSRVQTCLHGRDVQQSTQIFTTTLNQSREPLAIQVAHAAQVPAKVTFDNEIAQYCLIQTRAAQVRAITERQKRID